MMVAERVAWRPSLRRRGARGLSHRSGVNGRARVACRPSLRRRRAGTRPAARCAAGSRAPNPKGVWKAERTAEPKRLLDCARAFVGFAVGVRRPCLACFGTLSAPSVARPATGRCSVGARRPAVLVTARARGSPGSGHRTRVAAAGVTRHWRQDSMPWQKAVRASGEHRGEGGLAIAVGDLGIDARRPTRRTESGI